MRPNRILTCFLSLAATLACVTALAVTALAADGDTERVSVAPGGADGDGDAGLSSISADGRFVAFESEAANLVPADTNDADDIFVYDRLTQRTDRVSVSSSAVQANAGSTEPAISADGRFVAFDSIASNLVSGDTDFNNEDVFVRDRLLGTTERVSVSSAGLLGNGGSDEPSISADGRLVAFESAASNLVAGDTNSTQDVFVHDRQSGVTKRASIASGGVQGNEMSFDPAISADGRQVAFASRATTIVQFDSNAAADVFVSDLQAESTARVSFSDGGSQANADVLEPAISADGRFVAFSSPATNLVVDDSNGENDAFVRDRQAGATERVSVGSAGAQADGGSFDAAISGDGRLVAFASAATDLVPGDVNAAFDVFVRDRQASTTDLASVGLGGAAGEGGSFPPTISADGCFVAFGSAAANLVATDSNGFDDVFVHDLPGCPEPPPDPGGKPPDPADDLDPPDVDLSAKRRQPIAKPVELTISCDEPCAVLVEGRVKPKRGKRLNLGKVRAELAAGKPQKLKLRHSSRVGRKLRRAGRARATIVATAVDAATNTATARLEVRLTQRQGPPARAVARGKDRAATESSWRTQLLEQGA